MDTAVQNQGRKAVALLSGGLDSLLAARLIKDQGIEVTGLHLLSPFGCRDDVQKSADILGIPLVFKEKGPAYLDLLENPRFGYGKNMNPCIDCRVFMFQLADVIRQEIGADFIVTGEVLGQRPMSQHRHAFALIDSQSPIEGLVVRPLSAGRLDESIPEKMGWVRRNEFLKFSGRGRKDQIELAKKLGLKEYSQPGGGCLLTDASFSGRLRDFFACPTYKDESEKVKQSDLLSVGRCFRYSPSSRVHVGRNHTENLKLQEKGQLAGGVYVAALDYPGPKAVIFGDAPEEVTLWAGRLIAYYAKPPAGPQGNFEATGVHGINRFSIASALLESDINAKRVGVLEREIH